MSWAYNRNGNELRLHWTTQKQDGNWENVLLIRSVGWGKYNCRLGNGMGF